MHKLIHIYLRVEKLNVGKSFLIYTILFTLIITLSAAPSLADVPTVVQLTSRQEGTNTILVLKIRHANPSQSHYVNTVEIEINGNPISLTLNPQNSQTFEYEYNAGTLDSSANVRARAHCTLHGWSDWTNFSTSTTTSQSTTTSTPTTSTTQTTTTSTTTTQMTSTTSTTTPPSSSITFTRAEINLIAQISFGIAVIVGAILALKRKLKIHHKLMTIIIFLNAVTIIIVMGPSMVNIISQPSKNITTTTVVTVVHGIVGMMAEVIGVASLYKRLKHRKAWMKLLFSFWMISLVLGIIIYIQFYMS
jgi:hypothetical protein